MNKGQLHSNFKFHSTFCDEKNKNFDLQYIVNTR